MKAREHHGHECDYGLVRKPQCDRLPTFCSKTGSVLSRLSTDMES